MSEVFPIPTQDIVDKWDNEWLIYFSTQPKLQHLIHSDECRVSVDIRGLNRREVFNTTLTENDIVTMRPLRIWSTGDQIVGKNIAEIGSGAGFLGKQLGLVTASYLGIDVSQIAVAIARGNSPDNCRYYWLGQKDEIISEFNKYDTVVGREFFIHQNFENALWVVNLASHLLTKDGELCADFYLPNYEVEQGIIHNCRAPLDPSYASCAFIFEKDDIQELADAAGLAVVDVDDDISEFRRFVVMKKV
jgi:hypothetical protein